jgi:hypothetical protein
MSYKYDGRLGYAPWGVTNPWVFANYGQPQRFRGYVSPIVFQTQPPYVRSHHLGQAPVDPEIARADRMEQYTIAGLALSVASLGLFSWLAFRKPTIRNRMAANRRRRHRRRR